MRAVLYLRFSTEHQVNGYGRDAQRDAAETYARRQGWEVVAVPSDDGVSGVLDAVDRPALLDALGMLVTIWRTFWSFHGSTAWHVG